MENYITLESLIQEHKKRISALRYGGYFSRYDYPDMSEYQNWLAKTKRFLNINYPNDKYTEEFESISNELLSPEQQNKLLAILEAFVALPIVISNKHTKQATDVKKKEERESINVVTTINNTNTQEQNQEQSLAVNLFLEAIRDDLTGRQIKELKAVVAEADNDLQKARPNIIAKLKEFGTDVASNIIANILTNPIIWGGL